MIESGVRKSGETAQEGGSCPPSIPNDLLNSYPSSQMAGGIGTGLAQD